MFNWLKQKISKQDEPGWLRVQQPPGTKFPFPKGAKLRPEEEVLLAVPAAIITDNETIGDVFLIDDDALMTFNQEVGAWYVILKPGMTFSLSRSCEVMLIAKDTRPRFFKLLRPPQSNK